MFFDSTRLGFNLLQVLSMLIIRLAGDEDAEEQGKKRANTADFGDGAAPEPLATPPPIPAFEQDMQDLFADSEEASSADPAELAAPNALLDHSVELGDLFEQSASDEELFESAYEDQLPLLDEIFAAPPLRSPSIIAVCVR